MTCRPSDGPKGMTLVELRVQGVLPKRQIILQIVDLGGRQKQMPFLVWTWWRNERCESWCIIGSSKIVLIIRHHCDCHWHHHCQYQHQLRGKVKICIIWYCMSTTWDWSNEQLFANSQRHQTYLLQVKRPAGKEQLWCLFRPWSQERWWQLKANGLYILFLIMFSNQCHNHSS